MILRSDREPFEYIAPCDRDKHGKPVDGATVFVLRPDSKATQKLLTAYLRALPEGESMEIFEAARLAIQEIRNPGPGSEAIEFGKDGVLTEESLWLIDADARREIGLKFSEITGLTSADRKNSE